MTDPWTVRGTTDPSNILGIKVENTSLKNEGTITTFEDNFEPAESLQYLHASLPDSQEYLESLERRLKKIRRDSNIIQQLSAKREECLRSLLNETLNVDREYDIALNAAIAPDSAVQEICRYICPVQPLSLGETVHIVKHDQLEQQRLDEETSPEPASR